MLVYLYLPRTRINSCILCRFAAFNMSHVHTDIALEIQNVTVAYRSYRERPTSLKESFVRFITTGKLLHHSTFDALSDISLSIGRGAVLGLIGGNGSGKSTLLKVIAGVLKPIKGQVTRKGSIASLIELGAGFDPELNAIENLYLNGSLHKRSKEEIKDRIPAILEFAELNDFATTPVKYYSSGMFARLGFSAAVDINPDILLVDEILSVGDERFQHKCTKVFENFIAAGKTLVIVSHDLDMIQKRATEVALLSKGTLLMHGDPTIAISLYRDPHYQSALT